MNAANNSSKSNLKSISSLVLFEEGTGPPSQQVPQNRRQSPEVSTVRPNSEPASPSLRLINIEHTNGITTFDTTTPVFGSC